MPRSVAVVGSGPTGLYVLAALAACEEEFSVAVFESGTVAGVGFPYSRRYNSVHLLSNISSQEIPPIGPTFADWLRAQPNFVREGVGVHGEVSDTAYYPRIALGEYFRASFTEVVQKLRQGGCTVSVYTDTRVTDIRRAAGGWDLVVGDEDATFGTYHAEVVVVASGHQYDERPRVQGVRLIQGQTFLTSVHDVDPSAVGILGSSLSAIDTAVTLATEYGEFEGDVERMEFRQHDPSRPLRITMMSRNGLLPEGDFFYTLPIEENAVFTAARVQAEIERGSDGLLDRLFDLLVAEMETTAPRYLARYSLNTLNADTFADQHLAERRGVEPFLWARLNLAEAVITHEDQHVVPWRYLLLRCHELFGAAVPYLSDDDTRRFHRGLRSVFVDNYAAVPLLSVRRMISLYEAGVLDLVAVGNDYSITKRWDERPYQVTCDQGSFTFTALIDARGQTALPAAALPFPSLQRMVLEAAQETAEEATIPIDDSASLRVPGANNLYFWGLPFLLAERPFIQGLTASHEIAGRIVEAITTEEDELHHARSGGAPGS